MVNLAMRDRKRGPDGMPPSGPHLFERRSTPTRPARLPWPLRAVRVNRRPARPERPELDAANADDDHLLTSVVLGASCL